MKTALKYILGFFLWILCGTVMIFWVLAPFYLAITILQVIFS